MKKTGDYDGVRLCNSFWRSQVSCKNKHSLVPVLNFAYLRY